MPETKLFLERSWLREYGHGARILIARAFLRQLILFPFEGLGDRRLGEAALRLYALAAYMWDAALHARYSQHGLIVPDVDGLEALGARTGSARQVDFDMWSAAGSVLKVAKSNVDFLDNTISALNGILAIGSSIPEWSEDRLRLINGDVARVQSGLSPQHIGSQPLFDARTVEASRYLKIWESQQQLLLNRAEHWRIWIHWMGWRLAGEFRGPHTEMRFVRIPRTGDVASINKDLTELVYARGAHTLADIESPPPLPRQDLAPQFTLLQSGVLDIAPPEALDIEGNNPDVLRDLHPQLRELASEFVAAIDRPNKPYAILLDRAKAYLNSVDKPLSEIEIGSLYAAGVRLENALSATLGDINRGELAPLSSSEGEPIKSLLGIHGAFVLNTARGAALLLAERRYQRRPAEEREYSSAATAFAEELKNAPQVFTEKAASLIANAASEIGSGANPERSTVVGERIVLNAAIAVVGVATVAATPVALGAYVGGSMGSFIGAAVVWPLNEALKKTKAVSAVNNLITNGFDHLTHDLLPRALAEAGRIEALHSQLIRRVSPHLRRIAAIGTDNQWILRSLDWLERVEAEAAQIAKSGEGIGSADERRPDL